MTMLTRTKSGMLSYHYDTGSGMQFRFHLLNEVGEPYAPKFKAAIVERGWIVETRDLPHAPWVADFAITADQTSGS